MSDTGAPCGQGWDGRVLHVMWSLRIGGAERALYQLVLAQRAAGADVGMLVASELGLYGERLADAGVSVECLGQRSGANVFDPLRAASIFRRWPIVHFHAAEPPLMAVAATTRARRFYTHRAGAFAYPTSRRLRYAAAGSILRSRFDGVVGNTAHAANVAAGLFRIPRREISVVYNGLDWSLLRPERPEADVRAELSLAGDRFVVGTSGNLRDWKRVDLAVRAVWRTGVDIVLVIVGDGPDRPRLERLAQDLGITDRVRFTGTRANVADYLQVLDAFLLTSGPQESFGNSAVEAMGFGLPTIVMNDGGGLLEHVQHLENGLIALDVDDLARWLERLAAEDALGASLSATARERTSAKYTVDQMVEGYSRLYEKAPALSGATPNVAARGAS